MVFLYLVTPPLLWGISLISWDDNEKEKQSCIAHELCGVLDQPQKHIFQRRLRNPPLCDPLRLLPPAGHTRTPPGHQADQLYSSICERSRDRDANHVASHLNSSAIRQSSQPEVPEGGGGHHRKFDRIARHPERQIAAKGGDGSGLGHTEQCITGDMGHRGLLCTAHL